MKRVLVTGSSGHLGEALVRTLRELGREVVGLDVKPSPFTDAVGSIADRECVKACLAGAGTVFHAAALHKPHVATHGMREFVDVNIHGTLALLEEAVAAGVASFVFTSTTSVFGDALRPPRTAPAVWVTESLVPVPKNIYGVTKTAAEDLCRLFHRRQGLNCVVLRTSRFFPEDDDDKAVRDAYDADNAKANELLFRRVDVEDAVQAHLLADDKASSIGFGTYIISATTPFHRDDLAALRTHARAVLEKRVPGWASVYRERDWRMFPGIDRVYVNDAARKDLNWKPKYDFARAVSCLRDGKDPRSPLTQAVGAKAYHSESFAEGPYPVAE